MMQPSSTDDREDDYHDDRDDEFSESIMLMLPSTQSAYQLQLSNTNSYGNSNAVASSIYKDNKDAHSLVSSIIIPVGGMQPLVCTSNNGSQITEWRTFQEGDGCMQSKVADGRSTINKSFPSALTPLSPASQPSLSVCSSSSSERSLVATGEDYLSLINKGRKVQQQRLLESGGQEQQQHQTKERATSCSSSDTQKASNVKQGDETQSSMSLDRGSIDSAEPIPSSTEIFQVSRRAQFASRKRLREATKQQTNVTQSLSLDRGSGDTSIMSATCARMAWLTEDGADFGTSCHSLTDMHIYIAEFDRDSNASMTGSTKTSAWTADSGDECGSTICPQRMQIPTATAAAIGCCAVAGGMLLGPIGLIIGAAAIGLAAGYTQIPTKQRYYIQYVAQKGLKKGASAAQKATKQCDSLIEQALEALQDSACGEKLLKCSSCMTGTKGKDEGEDRTNKIDKNVHIDEPQSSTTSISSASIGGDQRGRTAGDSPSWDESSALVKRMTALAQPQAQSEDVNRSEDQDKNATDQKHSRGPRARRSRITIPISKIHTLAPSLHHSAWLDVIASPYTTIDEKTEGLEEVLLFARDKGHARLLLEDGVLDLLLMILTEFFQKYSSVLDHRERQLQGFLPPEDVNASSSRLEKEVIAIYALSRLAASCSVALGKSHCAAVHTNGELLLMSSYHNGMVPESRQVAQLLYEVPHHARTIETDGSDDGCRREMYTLIELSLKQAEDLSRMIMKLADGRMNPTNNLNNGVEHGLRTSSPTGILRKS